ncbi:MAG: AraC family transcriptional regulator [Tagaea sp.]|nr:AraC family transcriptional regulator [Tagaea sp.]
MDQGPAPISRDLAQGSFWRLARFECRAGPGDRPFEERHETASIAAVVSGSFTYRTRSGRAALHPGAVLLGEAGACFECGHDHGTGDLCLALGLSREDEIGFARPSLGPKAETRILVAGLHALAAARDPLRADEIAAALALRASALAQGTAPAGRAASAREERRIARAVRMIEARAAEKLDLAALAREAAMSKFHFLRVFRRVVGVTPYRYVIDLRLARAMESLARGHESATHAAFASGFGDLSAFVREFKRRYGAPPAAFGRDPAAALAAGGADSAPQKRAV